MFARSNRSDGGGDGDGGSVRSTADIINSIEMQTGDDRLDHDSLKNLPSNEGGGGGGGTTAPSVDYTISFGAANSNSGAYLPAEVRTVMGTRLTFDISIPPIADTSITAIKYRFRVSPARFLRIYNLALGSAIDVTDQFNNIGGSGSGIYVSNNQYSADARGHYRLVVQA